METSGDWLGDKKVSLYLLEKVLAANCSRRFTRDTAVETSGDWLGDKKVSLYVWRKY